MAGVSGKPHNPHDWMTNTQKTRMNGLNGTRHCRLFDTRGNLCRWIRLSCVSCSEQLEAQCSEMWPWRVDGGFFSPADIHCVALQLKGKKHGKAYGTPMTSTTDRIVICVWLQWWLRLMIDLTCQRISESALLCSIVTSFDVDTSEIGHDLNSCKTAHRAHAASNRYAHISEEIQPCERHPTSVGNCDSIDVSILRIFQALHTPNAVSSRSW